MKLEVGKFYQGYGDEKHRKFLFLEKCGDAYLFYDYELKNIRVLGEFYASRIEEWQEPAQSRLSAGYDVGADLRLHVDMQQQIDALTERVAKLESEKQDKPRPAGNYSVGTVLLSDEVASKRVVEVDKILNYLAEMIDHAKKRLTEASSPLDEAYYTGAVTAYENFNSAFKELCEAKEV